MKLTTQGSCPNTFAFARLDDRLTNSRVWQEACIARLHGNGRDPMGLTPGQPHVEFWNSECYGPPQTYQDFPSDGKSALAMITELFGAQSRGEVKLKSLDLMENPIVDHNHLGDSRGLEMLVLSEGCQLVNEIIMEGEGTRNIVKGSWPEHLKHHEHSTRDDWVPEIRERADTCKYRVLVLLCSGSLNADRRTRLSPSGNMQNGQLR